VNRVELHLHLEQMRAMLCSDPVPHGDLPMTVLSSGSATGIAWEVDSWTGWSASIAGLIRRRGSAGCFCLGHHDKMHRRWPPLQGTAVELSDDRQVRTARKGSFGGHLVGATVNPNVFQPASELAKTMPRCMEATAFTIDRPSPWLSPLFVRELSAR
jgi:hypothetical protein